jgi:protein TonB
MIPPKRFFTQNAFFLTLVIASVFGHLAVRNLRLEASYRPPELRDQQSGKTSISLQLVAADPKLQPETEPAKLPLTESDLLTKRTEPTESVVTSEMPSPTPVAAIEPKMKRTKHDPELSERATSPRLRRQPSQASIKLPDANAKVTARSQESSGAKVPPSITSRAVPRYPRELLLQGIEGRVMLELSIDAQGRVESTQLKSSSGYPAMDEAALETVRKWRFNPARRGNAPVASRAVVPVEFTIRR